MKYSWQKLIVNGIAISLCCSLLSGAAFATSSNIEGIQVYQKNVHLSAVHRQRIAAAIDRYNNADNIWGTMRQEFTLPHYEDNPRVQEQIQWFMNNQDFLYRSANRAAPYLYYILQQVRKRHLPGEVALLPIFESSFNPFASSPVGAAGIWQMMPNTATGLGVKQNWWYDGRRDVVTSTKAALNYLAYLGEFFDGNWLYAIAAYDTGEGNLLAAIKKNVRTGDSTDFWSLPVAQETQEYIPKLMALATIISHPDRYAVQLPYVRNAPYLAEVDVGTQIDLQHAADLAGLSYKTLKVLNPGYNRAITDPNGPYKLVLPIENVEQFSENLASSPVYRNKNWGHYKLRSGDNVKSLARKFKMSPDELRKINPELAHNRVRRGMSIVIPRETNTFNRKDIPDTFPQFSSLQKNDSVKVKRKLREVMSDHNLEVTRGQYSLQPGDTLYMVRDGDDVNKIAMRFHQSPKNIYAANNLNMNTGLQPGQQLIIPTHAPVENNETKSYQLNPGDTLYMVRRGDTIETIASKYHITAAMLRLANLMANNNVKEGDQIVIPTHIS